MYAAKSQRNSFTLYLDEKYVHPESFSLVGLKIISDTDVEYYTIIINQYYRTKYELILSVKRYHQ